MCFVFCFHECHVLLASWVFSYESGWCWEYIFFFPITFPNRFWLAHREATTFYVLILYSSTLMHSCWLSSFNVFSWILWADNHVTLNQGHLGLSFPIFISFFFLLSHCLKISSLENGIIAFPWYLTSNASNFSSFYMIFAPTPVSQTPDQKRTVFRNGIIT